MISGSMIQLSDSEFAFQISCNLYNVNKNAPPPPLSILGLVATGFLNDNEHI